MATATIIKCCYHHPPPPSPAPLLCSIQAFTALNGIRIKYALLGQPFAALPLLSNMCNYFATIHSRCFSIGEAAIHLVGVFILWWYYSCNTQTRNASSSSPICLTMLVCLFSLNLYKFVFVFVVWHPLSDGVVKHTHRFTFLFQFSLVHIVTYSIEHGRNCIQKNIQKKEANERKILVHDHVNGLYVCVCIRRFTVRCSFHFYRTILLTTLFFTKILCVPNGIGE